MSFSWPEFLQQYHVEFSDRGANVSKGHIVIHCPFCGSADPSQHLSINLDGKGWRCFRNHDHRGISPVRLISALTGMSYDQAASIPGRTLIPNDFAGKVKSLLNGNVSTTNISENLVLPDTFRRFGALPAQRPFVDYMIRRGFKRSKLFSLAEQFNLRYCVRGPFGYRLIFPIYFEGRLVNWTGRSIVADEPRRYKTLSTDPEAAKVQNLPVATVKVTDTLLWYDSLMQIDADTIYLVEGPFDALKVWYLGQRHGIVATCFYTSQGTERQIDLLHSLLPRFRRRWLLLDRGMMGTALRFHDQLGGLGVRVVSLPDSIKDPGELDSVVWLRSPGSRP